MTDGGLDHIGRIARAVLYEGYLLWPYRESSLKNQHRWTIGGVHPEECGDRSRIRTECLVEADPGAAVAVAVRFLHVVARIGAAGRGEEAREREVRVPELTLGGGPALARIDIAAGEERAEAEDREAGQELGAGVLRRWEALRGQVEVRAERLGPRLFRVTADVVNTTPWQPGGTREETMARTLVSAHVVLHAPEGRFVSQTDPPPDLREHAETCRNDGLWPVLAGEDLRTVLSAPIILYDQPQIAPESPGDLFDATEIDQLLTLCVLALSDGEREEIRAGDPRAREILDRCAALTQEELMRLSGAWRGRGPAG
ncbi:hypothetical protein [Nonomuraea fuscirosea]|uniref:hypothetical protein n=1 Tax=Nonomuraea fuscirosea TaxID=1291556 RepID=UPI0034028DA6